MKQRIITAVIALLALMLVLFLVPQQIAMLVIVAVMLGGAWEWSAFFGLSGNGGRVLYVIVISALLAAVMFLAVDAALIFKVTYALLGYFSRAKFKWNFTFPSVS